MAPFSKRLLVVSALVAAGAAPSALLAQEVTCQSATSRVKAVNRTGDIAVNTKFQLDTPNLEPLMRTVVSVAGPGRSCLVVNLSAQTRITDNYVVYQVRVDGVPMQGHTGGWFGVADPVLVTLFDDEDEQFVDPYRIVSHNFFARVAPGRHVVEVMVAGGSNIAPGLEPRVVSPVLTVFYR